ncbi:MAG: tannase/feruloyl esterase family alpha/beta hydrolase [Acidobacteria bacterium]|nr:MAG: tannase/feruloyl esterase family alpha/beta hydrolase [Acidobacteriota bacterium]
MSKHVNSDGFVVAAVLAAIFLFNPLPAAGSCESLASLKLPDTTITMAQSVAAGAFTVPAGGRGAAPRYDDLPAFCRVAATLKPTADSDIKIEVWLPASGWNAKFEAVGNGGWNGNIDINALATGLRRGYATSSTDTGHPGGGGPWMQSREKLIDFGYRAVHEMTMKAKAIVAAYYGNGPQLSYFNGCSAGGRQALKEAQRFPEDFDGIVAGAPALNTTGRAAFSMWVAQAMHKDEASYIPPSKYPLIHNAVLEACDAGDGVKDGVLENPKRCKFDPKVLECESGDAPTCLTPPQVESARKSYAAAVNPRTKQEIFPGLEPGSELGWATFASPQPFGLGAQMYQYMVFNDPNWDYKTLNFDTDMARTDKIENGTINALDTSLKPFFARGGKLIHYHGWGDPQITPMSSVNYYKGVLETMGSAGKVKDNYRLFMVPGMAHCGGGDGTSSFDMLSALEQWVEKHKAPEQILASRMRNGAVDRTRPLCPYPQVATYKGTGSTDEAANFVCKAQ